MKIKKIDKKLLAVVIAVVMFDMSAVAQEQPDEGGEASTTILQEEIVVVGFRHSLAKALKRKRDSSEIIEAISAEDIGELPDTSVVESLARLPGVAATRDVAGAEALSIRGLGSVLSNGTYNGRDLASASGDRSVPFSLFPAELISGAGVYKAPAASRIEGGVAGTIDLNTVRPLEYGEQSLVVNLRGRHNDLGGDLPTGEDKGYRGAITYIDQFADGTVGISLGYAGQKSPFASLQSSVFNYRECEFCGFIAGLPDVTSADNPNNNLNVPFGADQDITSGESTRHSYLGTIQVEASDNLYLTSDFFYSTFEQENLSAGLLMEGIGSFGNTFTDATVEGLNVTGGTATCNLGFVGSVNNCRDRGFGQSLFGQTSVDLDDSDLLSFGTGVVWDNDALTIKGDVSYSKAESDATFTRVEYRPYTGVAGSREIQLPVSTYGENSSGAAFLSSPLDFSNPATNRIDGANVFNQSNTQDEVLTFKIDGEYEFHSDFFTGIKAGVRLNYRENTLDSRRQRGNLLDPNDSIEITPDLVGGTFNHNSVDSDFGGNSILVLNAHAVLDQFFPDLAASPDPIGSHVINEDVMAYYLQADFATQIFSVPASGNLGVRVVDTGVETSGTATAEDAVTFVVTTSSVSTKDDYREFLPSLNLNLFPMDDFIVRLAASRALARPALSFLSPGVSSFGSETFAGSGGGGNPFLRPFIANQLDVSLEKYFDEDTALTLALYYKDVDTFITQARTETGSPQNLVSFTPANGEGGTIQGVEVLYQQTFTGLLPKGAGDIGIYANYSYADSDIQLTENFDSGSYGLDGLSKHVANMTLHYQREKFGARVSYRYRSEFTRPQRPAQAFITNDAEGDLSFQLSYDASDKLRFVLQGYNLTDEPRDGYYGDEILQGQYRKFGRNFEIGATYKFL